MLELFDLVYYLVELLVRWLDLGLLGFNVGMTGFK